MGSLLGANRAIIERWFALAHAQRVNAETLYRSALFWKSSPSFASPDRTPSPPVTRGECAIHFMKVEQKLWRFDNCHGHVPTLKILAPPYLELEKKIAQVSLERASRTREGLARLWSADSPSLSNRTLARELLAGLSLAGVRRLAVTPDLALGDIAWTAFPAPHTNGYLIDSMQVFQHHPGLATALSRGKAQPQSIGAIMSAGTAHDGDDRLPQLTQIAQELKTLEQTWPAVPMLKLTDIGRAVSQPSWQEIFERSAVVHIAAHGVRNELQPDLSAIVLSDGLGNIRLTPRDLAELEMGHVQLAVMNVCSSGFVRRGDTIVDVGFRTALLGRGTAAVVDTGWEISDERGADFAAAFYRKLRTGQTIERAFFYAVKEMRVANPDPDSWGAYSLSVRDLGAAARPFAPANARRQEPAPR